MRKLIGIFLVAALVAVIVSGCASSEMTSKKTSSDGTIVEYRVVINSLGQDFKGSDLAASLDPEGKTTIKAGAVDNTTSQVTADVAASMVELIKAMLPYITTPATP